MSSSPDMCASDRLASALERFRVTHPAPGSHAPVAHSISIGDSSLGRSASQDEQREGTRVLQSSSEAPLPDGERSATGRRPAERNSLLTPSYSEPCISSEHLQGSRSAVPDVQGPTTSNSEGLGFLTAAFRGFGPSEPSLTDLESQMLVDQMQQKVEFFDPAESRRVLEERLQSIRDVPANRSFPRAVETTTEILELMSHEPPVERGSAQVNCSPPEPAPPEPAQPEPAPQPEPAQPEQAPPPEPAVHLGSPFRRAEGEHARSSVVESAAGTVGDNRLTSLSWACSASSSASTSRGSDPERAVHFVGMPGCVCRECLGSPFRRAEGEQPLARSSVSDSAAGTAASPRRRWGSTARTQGFLPHGNKWYCQDRPDISHEYHHQALRALGHSARRHLISLPAQPSLGARFHRVTRRSAATASLHLRHLSRRGHISRATARRASQIE